MKAIIIGAGRGVRLMPTTANTPKCFAEVNNRRILEWGLQAFADNDIERICFIGGYAIEKVRKDYPHLEFYHNGNWENNNILASLMYAEPEMDEPFVCCYSDILFKPDIVSKLVSSEGDISLAVDTQWTLMENSSEWRNFRPKAHICCGNITTGLASATATNRIVRRRASGKPISFIFFRR